MCASPPKCTLAWYTTLQQNAWRGTSVKPITVDQYSYFSKAMRIQDISSLCISALLVVFLWCNTCTSLRLYQAEGAENEDLTVGYLIHHIIVLIQIKTNGHIGRGKGGWRRQSGWGAWRANRKVHTVYPVTFHEPVWPRPSGIMLWKWSWSMHETWRKRRK